MNLGAMYEMTYELPEVDSPCREKIDSSTINELFAAFKEKSPDRLPVLEERLNPFITGETEKQNKLKNEMIHKDFSLSGKTWDDYRKDFMSEVSGSLFDNLLTDQVYAYEERLKHCMSYVVKMWLNYKELKQFQNQYIKGVPLDQAEYAAVYPGQTVTAKTKVDRFEPFLENIEFKTPLLGDFFAKDQLVSDALVNIKRRKALSIINKIDSGFRLDLDNRETQRGLLELDFLDDEFQGKATSYFMGNISLETLEIAYGEWLGRGHGKVVNIAAKEFLNIKAFEGESKNLDSVVSEVLLGNFTNIQDLVTSHVPRKDGSELKLAGTPVDSEFALRLSRKLHDIGFLPQRVEYVCGVLGGDERPKRRSDSPSPKKAKIPRKRELFRPIVCS